TGELPFTGDNPGAVMMAHLQTPPPDPRGHAPGLSDSAAEAILQALSKDPKKRQSTAGEFANALG
ncbi:MAG: serine/threonine-protein kinase, partial [Anaerolineales bacterium]